MLLAPATFAFLEGRRAESSCGALRFTRDEEGVGRASTILPRAVSRAGRGGKRGRPEPSPSVPSCPRHEPEFYFTCESTRTAKKLCQNRQPDRQLPKKATNAGYNLQVRRPSTSPRPQPLLETLPCHRETVCVARGVLAARAGAHTRPSRHSPCAPRRAAQRPQQTATRNSGPPSGH